MFLYVFITVELLNHWMFIGCPFYYCRGFRWSFSFAAVQASEKPPEVKMETEEKPPEVSSRTEFRRRRGVDLFETCCTPPWAVLKS